MWAQQRGKMEEVRGMSSWTLKEFSAEFAGGKIEVFEGGQKRSERTGTRSCVQKGQRSPQEWTDRARHS